MLSFLGQKQYQCTKTGSSNLIGHCLINATLSYDKHATMLKVPRLDVHPPEPVVRQVVKEAFAKLGYHEPTQSQDEAIYHFIMSKDVFICLPTSSGMSLCHATLPLIFDILKHAAKHSSSTEARKSLVIVISPLIALMKDETAKFEECAVKSASNSLNKVCRCLLPSNPRIQ